MERSKISNNIYQKSSKRLKPKELVSKDKEAEVFGNLGAIANIGGSNNLPSLLPVFKGGNVIIQTWNTRTEIPQDLPLANLPIIVDPRKINDNMTLRNSLPSLETGIRKDDYLY